jgi:two-component system chemotaxis response regulator CheY
MDPRTILIVDDHGSFRALARDLLTMTGFEVVGEAADGRAALREASRLLPWVVLLDVRLPDIDGFTVARELSRRPAPPLVVLVSTRDASDYGGRVAESGAAGFIPKSRLSGDTLRAILVDPRKGVS